MAGSQAKRPVGVGIVSVLLVGVGGLALASAALLAGMESVERVNIALAGFGGAFAVTCGVGIWRGRNWARVLYVFGEPLILLTDAGLNGFEPNKIAGVAVYAIVVLVLVRKTADRFFSSGLLGEAVAEAPSREEGQIEVPQEVLDRVRRMNTWLAIIFGVIGGLGAAISYNMEEIRQLFGQ